MQEKRRRAVACLPAQRLAHAGRSRTALRRVASGLSISIDQADLLSIFSQIFDLHFYLIILNNHADAATYYYLATESSFLNRQHDETYLFIEKTPSDMRRVMNDMRSAESAFQLKPTMSSVLSVIAVLFGVSPPAHAGTAQLPSGGHFVAGSGSINGSGNTLTINQSGSRGVIDWNSFSIASGRQVAFNNGTGATLNRVTGGDPSLIAGALSATGSVYLINPQGVVIGPTGTVSTGGRFVASTLDTDNAAFMNGGPLTLSGHSNASVYNLGKIGSSGGDIFLVGAREVDNFGTIAAPKGTAEIVAGRQVLLQDSSSSRQVFVQTGSAGTVRNGGAIAAAQINLQAADGNIYALSGNHEALRASGTAQRDGHVWLVANTGTVALAGKIEAKNADASAGTVDTAANTLAFRHCAPTVSAAVWNITTPTFKLGDSAAASFAKSLNAGTSINVQTTGATGVANRRGDIDVTSNVGWNGGASLSLNAYRWINVGKGVTLENNGSGNLLLRADATGIDNGGAVVNHGTLDWSKSTGIVSAFYDMNGSYSPGELRANASWVSPVYSGLVTQITGYRLVNSLADLQNVALGLASNYALGKDIDASATASSTYVPLGHDGNAFTGQFDGQGHTIDSLTVNGQSGQAVGLFALLGKSAVVRDLNVNGTVTIAGAGQFPTSSGVEAVLAAENDGTIVHVSTSGSVGEGPNVWAGDYTLAGGLVGINRGTIVRSSSSASNGSGGSSGGLVGENDGLIAQSYASGSVSAPGLDGPVLSGSVGSPGGLVGTNAGTITESYATGSVSSGCGFSGFVCGSAAGLVYNNTGTISQSFATGTLSVQLPVDGLPPPTADGIAVQNTGKIANDVYWNRETTTAANGSESGEPPSANGLTTAQMSTPASFVGWNFGAGGDWVMPPGATHPVLAWQTTSPGSR